MYVANPCVNVASDNVIPPNPHPARQVEIMAIVTLTTDFGPSGYVAEMKGVIYSIAPSANIVDITHSIHPQNILEGAHVLRQVAPHFPNAVHVGVVDPGVGTSRRPILVECERGILIGPDNGLLIPAARRLGLLRVIHLSKGEFFRKEVSRTFHGRDIFAPVSGHALSGRAPGEMGEEITDWIGLELDHSSSEEGAIIGKVLHIDRFGNLITNIPADTIKSHFGAGDLMEVKLGGPGYLLQLIETYGDEKEGELIATISSSGHLEISQVGGSAWEQLGGIVPGHEVRLKLPK